MLLGLEVELLVPFEGLSEQPLPHFRMNRVISFFDVSHVSYALTPLVEANALPPQEELSHGFRVLGAGPTRTHKALLLPLLLVHNDLFLKTATLALKTFDLRPHHSFLFASSLALPLEEGAHQQSTVESETTIHERGGELGPLVLRVLLPASQVRLHLR